jgi:predicted phosphate transport protein (TIGR00153 family)
MRFRLVPTDDRFFDLFDDAAANAAECARRLRKILADGQGRDYGLIIECERRGDELTRTIVQRLNSTFVTPFDREDIHALAEELDDVVDDILEVSYRIQLSSINEPLPELLQQADVLVQMTESTVELVSRLSSMKGVQPYLDTIDGLESEGDRVYRAALGRLFAGEFDGVEVVKWKDIIEAMEAALNTVEDISDVVESIVLKHA